MQKLIRLSKSCISEAEKKAVMDVLDREYLGMGEDVRKFETALSDFFGRPAVCVVNGTAALQLALQACGIGPGDEVLTPSLTYVASFQAISATGAKPVACDVDASSLMIDMADAEKRLTARTKAIMPVHYTGGVADIDAIYRFAEKNNLRVIEDAAHAFGTTWRDKKIGGIGDICCFSFDGIKNITSGEGGCIVSSDENILQHIRDARLLGVEKDTEKRYTGQRSWEFDVVSQGWRYHMSNIMAAIGVTQLQRFGTFSAHRQKLAKLYDELLGAQQGITLLDRNYDEVVPHIYVVRLHGSRSRKEMQEKMLEENIQTGIHYQPNHWLSFYKKADELPLPVTETISQQIITLPLHADLTEEDVQRVASTLIKYIN